jgi:signal transduction histidine kinase
VSQAATVHQFHGRPVPRRLIDVAVALVALVGSFAQLSHGGAWASPEGGDLDLTGGLLAACSAVPLLAWRGAPRAVFAFTGAMAILLGATGHALALALGPAIALFLLAATRDEDDPWTTSDSLLALTLFAGYLAASGFGEGELPGSELLHTGLAWAVAWFAGDRARLRHEHIADLAERAVRAERDAERERRLAVAEERARIARDLHDAAGHAINVIAVQAGAARMRRDPERSQAALEEIEELARNTVAEIDGIVGSLREPGESNGTVDDPPGLASLDTLVARHSAAGLEVTVVRAGEAPRLAAAVDQAAYRILQESLTNAARYGDRAAEVELVFADTALDITIENGLSGETSARSNGGHGLVGMRERAALLGGALEVQHSTDSFRVHARLPYRGGG